MKIDILLKERKQSMVIHLIVLELFHSQKLIGITINIDIPS